MINTREQNLVALKDRFVGSLFGLACGDALGASVEFSLPGTFAPVHEMIGGGPAGLEPGQWTDDTSMALCLAESLLECRGFDALDQMQRYVRWYKEGHLSSIGRCFDIGRTTQASLDKFIETGQPYCGTLNERTAGNGSIMRLAPVPLFFFRNPEIAIELSEDSSRTTHGALACLHACRYLGALIVGALQGAAKDELLSAHYSPVESCLEFEKIPLCDEVAAVAAGSFKTKQPPQIRGSGYVVESLEAALWAFYRSDNFRDGCLLAVNLGDDADTTAAVYGQLAGAFYGIEAIPPEWLQVLAMRDLIEQVAMSLYRESKTR